MVTTLADSRRFVTGAAARIHQALVRLVPGRLRRIYVPSAYSAIDRSAVIFFGFTCGVLQALGRFPLPQDGWTYWSANLDKLYPKEWVQTVYSYTRRL
jgi:hypothetical protein